MPRRNRPSRRKSTDRPHLEPMPDPTSAEELHAAALRLVDAGLASPLILGPRRHPIYATPATGAPQR